MFKNWLKSIIESIIREDHEQREAQMQAKVDHQIRADDFISGTKEVNRIYEIANGYLVHVMPSHDLSRQTSSSMMYCKNPTAIGRYLATKRAKERLGINDQSDVQGELDLATVGKAVPGLRASPTGQSQIQGVQSR